MRNGTGESGYKPNKQRANWVLKDGTRLACSVNECAHRAFVKGMCLEHYQISYQAERRRKAKAFRATSQEQLSAHPTSGLTDGIVQ